MLCYHSVKPEQISRFQRQMEYLIGNVVSVDQIGVGKPGVCLTFDDAYAGLVENALPVTSQYEFPVAIFPVTENLDKSPQWVMRDGDLNKDLPTLSRDDLQAICGNPLVTIGSHTATHLPLGEQNASVVLNELKTSRDFLAGMMTVAPEDLSLPYGSFNESVCELARQTGYKRIYTLQPMVNSTLLSDGLVGRFEVDPDMTMTEFRLTVAGSYWFLRPFRRSINQFKSWSKSIIGYPRISRRCANWVRSWRAIN